jgi:hypothetical protein
LGGASSGEEAKEESHRSGCPKSEEDADKGKACLPPRILLDGLLPRTFSDGHHGDDRCHAKDDPQRAEEGTVLAEAALDANGEAVGPM